MAYVSHVIEHLPTVEDAGLAMYELRRVADHVVIVSPHWFDIINQFHPGHHLIVEPEGLTVDSPLMVKPRQRSRYETNSKVAI